MQNLQEGIEFAKSILHEESLTKPLKVRYTSVIYYLRLCCEGESKKRASEIVSALHGAGPWRARLIRKWADICLQGKHL
jgi:hypothetical protein